MQLVQLLLPMYDKEGKLFPRSHYEDIKKELSETFGGLTAYTRSPASGFWKSPDDEKIVKDDVYVFEVMATHADIGYWRQYKVKLQAMFRQEELIVRTSTITLI